MIVVKKQPVAALEIANVDMPLNRIFGAPDGFGCANYTVYDPIDEIRYVLGFDAYIINQREHIARTGQPAKRPFRTRISAAGQYLQDVAGNRRTAFIFEGTKPNDYGWLRIPDEVDDDMGFVPTVEATVAMAMELDVVNPLPWNVVTSMGEILFLQDAFPEERWFVPVLGARNERFLQATKSEDVISIKRVKVAEGWGGLELTRCDAEHKPRKPEPGRSWGFRKALGDRRTQYSGIEIYFKDEDSENGSLWQVHYAGGIPDPRPDSAK